MEYPPLKTRRSECTPLFLPTFVLLIHCSSLTLTLVLNSFIKIPRLQILQSITDAHSDVLHSFVPFLWSVDFKVFLYHLFTP